jgi:hypothetical protein
MIIYLSLKLTFRYGMSWNNLIKGALLTASEDQTIVQWDLNQYTKEKRIINPFRTFRGHTSVVEVYFRAYYWNSN